MNKKIYLEPEMEVLEIKLSQMICSSVSDDTEVPTGDSDEEAGGGW